MGICSLLRHVSSPDRTQVRSLGLVEGTFTTEPSYRPDESLDGVLLQLKSFNVLSPKMKSKCL